MTKEQIIGNVAFILGLLIVVAALYSWCPAVSGVVAGLVMCLFGFSLAKGYGKE